MINLRGCVNFPRDIIFFFPFASRLILFPRGNLELPKSVCEHISHNVFQRDKASHPGKDGKFPQKCWAMEPLESRIYWADSRNSPNLGKIILRRGWFVSLHRHRNKFEFKAFAPPHKTSVMKGSSENCFTFAKRVGRGGEGVWGGLRDAWLLKV